MLLHSISICAQNCSCLFLILQLGRWGRGCYRALLKLALTRSSSPLAMGVLAHWLPGLCPGRVAYFWDSCLAFSHPGELAVLSCHWGKFHTCCLYCHRVGWPCPSKLVQIHWCLLQERRLWSHPSPDWACSYQEKGGVLPQVSSLWPTNTSWSSSWR